MLRQETILQVDPRLADDLIRANQVVVFHSNAQVFLQRQNHFNLKHSFKSIIKTLVNYLISLDFLDINFGLPSEFRVRWVGNIIVAAVYFGFSHLDLNIRIGL